jgi:chromosome partitioning protein
MFTGISFILLLMKIAVTNLKGGVGKSTLSINLAVCLAHRGSSVCIVDTDENRNSIQWYGYRDENLPKVLVVGAVEPRALNKTVDSLNEKHDFVILDGTPNLGEMNTRIIMASDLLIIPIRPAAHDFRTISTFLERLEKAKEFRDNIKACFVVNEYNDKVNLFRDIKDQLKAEYDIPVLNTTIKSRLAYVHSSLSGNGVLEYSDTKAKAEIEAFTNEVIELTKIVINNE